MSDTFDHVSFRQLLNDDSWMQYVDWDNDPFLPEIPTEESLAEGEAAAPQRETDLALTNGIVR